MASNFILTPPILAGSSGTSGSTLESSKTQSKRPISPNSEFAAKRPKFAECPTEKTDVERDLRQAFSNFDHSLHTLSEDDHQVKLEMSDVPPAEFLRLSKLGGMTSLLVLRYSVLLTSN